MKSLLAKLSILLGVITHALAQTAAPPFDFSTDQPGTAPFVTPLVAPEPVRSHQEVLALVPRELAASKPGDWSEAQKARVNAILKKQLVDTRTPASLHLRMANVAHWPGLTLHGDIPNDAGCFIRVFGGFDEKMQPQLATLKKGEAVLLEGELTQAKYETVWGSLALSICLKNCSFARAPMIPSPTDVTAASAGIRVVSAVYGSGVNFADVTARVNELLQQSEMEFFAQPPWLHADPTPGWNKALVIVFERAGERHLFSTGEGGQVSARLLAKSADK